MPSTKLKDFGLYFITDSRLTKRTVIDDAKAAIKGGVKVIQYREKNAPARRMILEAKKIKKLCQKNNVLFLVNDSIDVALAVNADGIHIGDDDVPYKYARKLLGKDKIIGVSAQSVKEALFNEKIGADYTGIGPIYYTATKKINRPIGLAPIKELKTRLKIPFVAIGGINQNNIDEILKAGAKNMAVISAIVTKHDVESTVRDFVRKIKQFK